MAWVDHTKRELTAKIAYVGPYAGGKTTNVVALGRLLSAAHCGRRISLATEAEQTHLFDFVPITLGLLNGYEVHLQVYAVAGRDPAEATSKLILTDADAVVFVADSSAARLADNLAALAALLPVYNERHKTKLPLPVVMQYNKRDVADAMALAELESRLNPYVWPSRPSCASGGEGVVATLKEVAQAMLMAMAAGDSAAMPSNEAGLGRKKFLGN